LFLLVNRGLDSPADRALPASYGAESVVVAE
jgi:hypothetical protein